MGIRTSALEEKATACTLLSNYIGQLGAGFYPYVEEAAKTMIPLLKFYISDDVRVSAAASLPEMIRSVVQYHQRNRTWSIERGHVMGGG